MLGLRNRSNRGFVSSVVVTGEPGFELEEEEGGNAKSVEDVGRKGLIGFSAIATILSVACKISYRLREVKGWGVVVADRGSQQSSGLGTFVPVRGSPYLFSRPLLSQTNHKCCKTQCQSVHIDSPCPEAW